MSYLLLGCDLFVLHDCKNNKNNHITKKTKNIATTQAIHRLNMIIDNTNGYNPIKIKVIMVVMIVLVIVLVV